MIVGVNFGFLPASVDIMSGISNLTSRSPAHCHCRFSVSFFSFFASFFSLGVLVATFFCAFLASWVLLMVSSYVESRRVRRDAPSSDQHARF